MEPLGAVNNTCNPKYPPPPPTTLTICKLTDGWHRSGSLWCSPALPVLLSLLTSVAPGTECLHPASTADTPSGGHPAGASTPSPQPCPAGTMAAAAAAASSSGPPPTSSEAWGAAHPRAWVQCAPG